MSITAGGHAPGNGLDQHDVGDIILLFFYPALFALCLSVIVGALRRQSTMRAVLLLVTSALCGVVIARSVSWSVISLEHLLNHL